MDKELFKKLVGEQALTAEEALRLDEALEVTRTAKDVVEELPDETPSLSWRSGLNQRLALVSKRRRTVVLLRFGMAATAVAAASLLAITLFQPINKPKPAGAHYAENEPSLEETILSGHEEATSQASLGVYVAYDETGS
jgi:hypothetical protein